MVIDTEPSVDCITLNNLIKKAAIEETKQLHLQLHKMNDKIATITSMQQKNSASRSNGSASGKNKQVTNTKSTFQHQKQNNKTNTNGRKNKADTPNNASKQENWKAEEEKVYITAKQQKGLINQEIQCTEWIKQKVA
eukprot:9723519-Ditylum_brightwellii.AAC.1